MKDNEPNINVPLLASKGEGWEKEWDKIQQYVFKEGADEYGITPFLRRRINNTLSDVNNYKMLKLRTALFLSLHKKWCGSGVVDFILPEGASFFDVCISKKSIWHLNCNIASQNDSVKRRRPLSRKLDRVRRNLGELNECEQENWDRYRMHIENSEMLSFEKLQQDPENWEAPADNHEDDLEFSSDEERSMYKDAPIRMCENKIVRDLENYCVSKYTRKDFPTSKVETAGVQLFYHYTNYPSNVGIGIETLKKPVFAKFGEEEIRQAITKAMDELEKKIQQEGIGKESRQKNSRRDEQQARRLIQYKYALLFRPIYLPQPVHEFFGIDIDRIPEFLQSYRKLLPEIFPDVTKWDFPKINKKEISK